MLSRGDGVVVVVVEDIFTEMSEMVSATRGLHILHLLESTIWWRAAVAACKFN